MKKSLVASSLVAALCLSAFVAEAAIDRRAYSGGSYAVFVDGGYAGWAKSFSGGSAVGTVVTSRAGAAGNYPQKQIGGVTYQEVAVVVGAASIEKTMAQWITSTVNSAQPVRKPGSIATLDFNLKEQARLSWTNGFLSDVTFPALDATSKDAATISVLITPESTTRSSASAGAAVPSAGPSKAKSAVVSNFKITIPGLEQVTPYITRVDPISVRLKAVTGAVGELRDYEKTAGTVDVSHFSFTVPENRAAQVIQWHESFVVKGQNSADKEKQVTVELLDSALKAPLVRLTLGGVGVVSITGDAASNESARTLRVDCYVESVRVDQL